MEEKNFGYLGMSFQQNLIKTIIEDKKYGETIIDVLESKYFDNNSFKYIMENLKELYKSYSKIPDYTSLAQKILTENGNNRETSKVHLDTLEAIKKNSQDNGIVKDTALNFCKQQNLKKELKLVNTIIENGDFEEYSKIETIIRTALQVGTTTDDVIDVFFDIEGSLARDYRHTIPTGITGIDDLLKGGLGRGELGLILAPTGTGKALGVSCPILTPNGWIKMGDVKLDDDVIGSDGKKQKVVGVYPQGIRPIYKMEFTDGTSVECDEEHLWSVNTLNMRTRKIRINGVNTYSPDNGYIVMKTSNLMKDIKKRGRHNYRLPTVEPIEFIEREIKIDAYLLGILLGDGHFPLKNNVTLSTKDEEIFENIKYLNLHTSFNEYVRKNGNTIKKIGFKSIIKKDLINYNLLGRKSNNKFIPEDFLYNSLENRVKLLQGLMDTDGYIGKNGCVQYTTVSEELCYNIKQLVLSLGGSVKIKTKKPFYTYKGEKKEGQLSYILTISFGNNIIPFTLEKHLVRYNKREKYINQKFIDSINYSHDEEAICIKVSNEDELFVMKDYVLTHNTSILTKIGNSAHREGYNVLQIFFEDNPSSIKRKHYTIWSGITPDGQSEDAEYVTKCVENAQSNSTGQLRLLKLPSDGTTLTDIRNKVRKMIADGFHIDLLIIDYADCISSKSNDEEWKGEGAIMRGLETMASEFDFALWSAVQGSRSAISSEIVTTDQMGGSIKKAQIAHIIISLAKTLEQKEHNLATMAILKSRIGKDGIIFQNCKFDNEFLIIDTDTQNTLLGVEEAKVEDKQKRLKDAYERSQQNKQE